MKTDNELITIFMGGIWNKHTNTYGIGNAELVTIGKYKDYVRAINHYEVNQLKYDTSWDWLMPVFPELRKAGYLSTVQVTPEGDPDLTATYNRLVELIKYINSQK